MTLRDHTRNAAYRSLSFLAGGADAPVVAMYHSVGGGTAASVAREAFADQMAILAERFSVLTLSEFRRALSAGPPARPLACLTFDDGYRDQYDHALPLLERHGLRATFFVATGCLGATYRSWAAAHPAMSVDDVRTLATLGHEVGAHSVTHAALPALPADALRREVVDSKARLEEITGRPVRAFAYPKGVHDARVRRAVADAGFTSAVTVREGVVTPDVDWLAVPRFAVHGGLSRKGFAAKLSPAGEWYERLRVPLAAARLRLGGR